MKVLFEGARSALPPIKNGAFLQMEFKTFPDALLVAMGLSDGLKQGKPLDHSPESMDSFKDKNSFASAGCSFEYFLNVSFHSFSRPSPLVIASLKKFSASSGMKKSGSSGQPNLVLASFASFPPSGAPCASEVFSLAGLPKPILVLAIIRDGLAFSSF